MKTLSKQERMQLMRFVCSFAWADQEIQQQEREFVANLAQKLALDDEEKMEVQALLRRPPRPEDVDPAMVPREHRKLFLDTAKQVIEADGNIDAGEQENFQLLEELLSY